MQYRFAEFVLDLDAGTLFGPDGALSLRQRSFQLLVLLVEQAPALLSRNELVDRVWGHDALSPAVLAQAIGEIRQALGDSAQNPRLIETKHRRGYRLMVPVQRLASGTVAVAVAGDAAEPAPQPAVASSAEPVAAPTPRRTRSFWLPTTVAVLALALALIVWLSRPDGAGTDAGAGVEPRPALALLLGAGAATPPWLTLAGTELLSTALANDERVQLVRADGRSDQPDRNDLRWQTWLREILGVDFAVTGIWRVVEGENVLNYSLVALDDGRILHGAEHRDGDLATLSQQVATELRRHLRVVEGEGAWMTGLPRGEPARQAFYRGTAALAEGANSEAIQALEQALADPEAGTRVRLALAAAYRAAGQLTQARGQFAELLASVDELPLGERLRLEAEAALADHRPSDAAASMRALHRLMPDDREVTLALLDTQIQARQIRAAGDTLASLERLAGGGSDDPRWHLARARLAQLRHQPDSAAEAADQAERLAERFGMDEIAAQARLERIRVHQDQGDLDTARTALTALLAGDPPQPLRAQAQLQLGNLLRTQGEFNPAEQALDDAITAFAERGDRAGELYARTERHAIESERGHSDDGYQQLLDMAPQVAALGDALLLARYFNTLGVQAVRNQHIEDAEQHLRHAASEARRAGQPRLEAGAFNNLAMALARGNRLDEAASTWQQALNVFQDSGDRRGQAITLGNLASIADVQGQLPRSRELGRQALALMRDLGMKQDSARIAFNLGLVSEREGDLLDAEGRVREALQGYREVGAGADLTGSVSAVHIRLLVALADLDGARGELAAARALFDQAGSPLVRSHLLTSQGELERLAGNPNAARDLFGQARGQREQIGRSHWLDMSEVDLLALDLDTGRAAEQVHVAAERIASRMARAGDPRGQSRARLLQARALILDQRADDALSVLDQVATLLAESAEATLSFEADRLRILAGQGRGSPPAARLNGLADEAERLGFRLFALRCRLDAAPDDTGLIARARDLGFPGLLAASARPPP